MILAKIVQNHGICKCLHKLLSIELGWGLILFFRIITVRHFCCVAINVEVEQKRLHVSRKCLLVVEAFSYYQFLAEFPH